MFSDVSRSDFHGLEPLEARQLMSSAKPTLAPLGNQTLLGGAPLLIPLNKLNPNAKKAKLAAITSDPNVTARVISSGLTMKIDVKGYGSMTFALFNRLVPRVTKQITKLAKQGFYDGIIFHRIIDGFMIQGGDPTGTGSGGSKLPDFDDQFHPDLQHTTGGLLSMANAGDDTNDSQFFITEAPTRWLDFNHSIFGKLVSGENVREKISNVATDDNDRPKKPIVISNVTVFKDKSNAVLMLKAPEGYSGDATVSVTASAATRAKVKRVTRTFTATVQADTQNARPYVTDVPTLTAKSGQQFQYQIPAIDVEGDSITYGAFQITQNVETNFSVDTSTGIFTLTPPANFTGIIEISVGVRKTTGFDTNDPWDTQTIRINVTA